MELDEIVALSVKHNAADLHLCSGHLPHWRRQGVLEPIPQQNALDGGWLKRDQQDPYGSGSLWGSAIGIGTRNQTVSTQFTLGIPVSYPSYLAPDHLNVYARVTLVF